MVVGLVLVSCNVMGLVCKGGFGLASINQSINKSINQNYKCMIMEWNDMTTLGMVERWTRWDV